MAKASEMKFKVILGAPERVFALDLLGEGLTDKFLSSALSFLICKMGGWLKHALRTSWPRRQEVVFCPGCQGHHSQKGGSLAGLLGPCRGLCACLAWSHDGPCAQEGAVEL